MTVVRNKTNKILSNTNINQFASTRTKKTLTFRLLLTVMMMSSVPLK